MNASGSVIPCLVCSKPLARSTSLRVSNRSDSVATSFSSAADLAEPADRHLDRGDEVGDGERLDQIRHRTRVAGPLDQVALAERGEDDDRRDALAGDLRCGVDAVAARHLDVHDHQIRLEALGQIDGLLPVAGLADDLVAFFAQHLGQVQPDERFVFGDENTAWLFGVGR